MKLPTLNAYLDMINQQLDFTDHVRVSNTFLHTLDWDGAQDERVGFIHATMAIRDGRRPDFSYTETWKQKWERGLEERQLVAEYWPACDTYRVRKKSPGPKPGAHSDSLLSSAAGCFYSAATTPPSPRGGS